VPAAARLSDDLTRLRRCIRDLLALSALPAIWHDQNARHIGESVADALIGVLGLEFVYVALGDEAHELVRTGNPHGAARVAEVRDALADWLGPHLPDYPVRIGNPVGSGMVHVFFTRIGLAPGEILVAASRNPDFPTQTEHLLLSVAANQTALALQRRRTEQALRESEARLRQLSEELEQRVAERTRQLEEEIAERERAEAAFRQAQRMEAMGQLTGGIAHDFNNLLLVIGGNLELLRTKVGGIGAERQLDAIEQATRRGESLTRQLLTFSRRQTLRPAVIDLSERLPRLMELIRPSLRGDIEVELDMDRKIWSVEVDPGELELALLNIAANARDAMPRGGKLVLAAHNRSFEPGEPPGGISAGEYVAISLSDTGEGIPDEILPRVFEPFYTTKEVGRGTGLGLSQVYGFARQSGGMAIIESQLGVGTVVTLLLPISTAAASVDTAMERVHSKSRISGTILLVEDNDEVAEITVSLLQELGCRTRRARTARQALEMLSGDSIDLVLTDIIMPGGMNGLDLARSLRDRLPELPILLTTGYSSAAQDAASLGFPILPKPYRRNQLEEAVFGLLGSAALPRNALERVRGGS
jgi:signal transduction histidine kinase/CheY-like chemotaxis protein